MTKRIAVGVVLICLVLAGAAGAQQQQQQQEEKKQQPPSPTQFGVQQSGTQFGAPTGELTEEEKAAIDKIIATTDPAERLALVEDFLAKYPQSPGRDAVYAFACESARMQNDLNKAVEYGEKALELNPLNTVALIHTADSLAEGTLPSYPDAQERLARAEEYARRALEGLPEFFSRMTRRPETPEEEYNLQQKYWEAQPHAILGSIHIRRNEYAAAEEELRLATELNQYRPSAFDFLRLGVVQYRQKEYEDAEKSLQRCIELGGPAAEIAERQLKSVQTLLRIQKSKSEN